MLMGAIFSSWRNQIPHLYFICNSMSGAIVSDCPTAAICHMAATCNAMLVEKFSFYCYTTTICLYIMVQHHKIGGITFRASL